MNYSVEEEFLKKVVVDSYKSQIKNKKFSVEDKQNVGFNSDYVTSCDVNTEKYIIEKIKRKFPNDHVVSEEFNSNSNFKLLVNLLYIDSIVVKIYPH